MPCPPRDHRGEVLEHYGRRWEEATPESLRARPASRAEVLEAIADALPARRPLLVLDLGVGPATVPAHLLAGPRAAGLRIVGLDMTSSALARGRELVASMGVGDRLDLVAGLMERLPFRDGAFGAAVSLLALNLVDDKAGALAEAARVVAPGGTVVIGDCVRPDGAPCARGAGHGAWARCLAGAPTAEGLRRLLEGAGLAPVREVDMTAAVRRLTGGGGGWDWPEFNEHQLGFVLSVLRRP